LPHKLPPVLGVNADLGTCQGSREPLGALGGPQG
jgi:hypothetical protein